MVNGLSSESVRYLLRQLVEYPYADVCRHHVAAMILSRMEEDNPDMQEDSEYRDLCVAVCSNSHGDAKALELLDNK